MFCVTTVRRTPSVPRSASARWAAPGFTFPTRSKREAKKTQVLSGSKASASAVAYSSGSNVSQIPPGERKSGTPDSTLTPAPVRAVPGRWATSSSAALLAMPTAAAPPGETIAQPPPPR